MTETYLFYGFCGLTLLVPMVVYVWFQGNKEKLAQAAVAKGQVFSDGPRGQHPHIDVSHCIGCQGCTSVCPEGSVLGMVGGKAAVIRPYKCIGHGLCAEACPVGAITLRHAAAGVSADLPYLTPDGETSVPNLFIAGELGGLALIRNAVRQGRECVDVIAERLAAKGRRPSEEVHDVLIVGAGPAGISASLRAIELGLNYVTVEREEIGGTITKYPRQKLVMTGHVEFPLYGALKGRELSKEALLAFWSSVGSRGDFRVRLKEPVERIRRDEHGIFRVKTPVGEYRAWAVVLAMGRNGVPRKLGVKGEDLPKVMYRLLEADHYLGKNILVVGGGDSAVEAAVGLAMQKGNKVTLSYRKAEFSRIKDRNAQRLAEAERGGKLTVMLNSIPVEFTEASAIVEVDGKTQELPNDFVWIFAGGVAPNEFLKQTGVAFGSQEFTAEAAQAALAPELERRDSCRELSAARGEVRL